MSNVIEEAAMAVSMGPADEVFRRIKLHEPRSMTLADLLVIVAGVGISFTIPPISGFPPPFIPISPGFIIAALVDWSLLAAGLTTSLVILVRLMAYRRPARPAEWLAILVALLLVLRTVPDLDTVVNRAFGREWLSNSLGTCRWIVGGIGLAAFLVGIMVLVAMRRVMPHWARTLVLAALALVLLWGPLDVFSREAPWLLPSWTEGRPEWLFWASVEGRRYAAMLPLGLLFGVPARAALARWERRGTRRWIWTEGLGLGTALLLGSLWLGSLYGLRSEWPPDGLNAERAVVPVWIVGVWWLSRAIVRRFGDAWERWLSFGASATMGGRSGADP
jgi:hypothetical protein